MCVLACLAPLPAGLVARKEAHAGNASANLDVSARVSKNCLISAASLVFADYDPIGANATTPLQATATIQVTCTKEAQTIIDLDQGLNPAAGSTSILPRRQMLSGSAMLLYDIFQDAGGTVWGQGAPASRAYLGSGLTDSLTVYGQLPAGQNVPAGDYGDTITATVNF